jgi:hypothetical protein
MNSPNEARFRRIESQLDSLLQSHESLLAARGISAIDQSVRGYYPNERNLSWSFRFEERRSRGSEVEKVWLTLSLVDTDLTAIGVWRRAEIFQIGSRSSWQQTNESVLSVEAVFAEGLAPIIIREVEAGYAAIELGRAG